MAGDRRAGEAPNVRENSGGHCMLIFIILVEAVIVGLAVWLWRAKPKFENDDVSMPLGVAVSVFLGNRAAQSGSGERPSSGITLSRVLAIILVIAAVAWPVYAGLTIGF
jgi:hypothetical protein